jgi:predicted alpha/beta-hydrolase family hydrolase
VAAQLATSRLRLDGLFFMGYPLHVQDRPDQTRAEHLYRIISPMLFVQGTRDRQCDLDALRRVLSRVGAPTSLHVAQEADQNFRIPKKSEGNDEDMRSEVLEIVTAWFGKILDQG